MKIIAQQGHDRFLVETEQDKGVIVDIEENKVSPPFNVHSILARGYWEDFTDTDKEEIILNLVGKALVLL